MATKVIPAVMKMTAEEMKKALADMEAAGTTSYEYQTKVTVEVPARKSTPQQDTANLLNSLKNALAILPHEVDAVVDVLDRNLKYVYSGSPSIVPTTDTGATKGEDGKLTGGTGQKTSSWTRTEIPKTKGMLAASLLNYMEEESKVLKAQKKQGWEVKSQKLDDAIPVLTEYVEAQLKAELLAREAAAKAAAEIAAKAEAEKTKVEPEAPKAKKVGK